MSFGKKIRTTLIAAGAALALGSGVFAGLGPVPGNASSHREAPLTAADPQIDGTDLYAFVSRDRPQTVTIVSNWIPLEEPAGGPNFYAFQDGVHYDINVDNNGDAVPDVIYRWTFTSHYRQSQIPGTNGESFLYNEGQVNNLSDPTLLFYQTYDLDEIRGQQDETLLNDAPVVPVDVGAASMPDYNSLMLQGVQTAEGGEVSWVGQADDPFFLDLRVFDLLYGGNFGEAGDDTLAGFNVHGMVLQVPRTDLAFKGKAGRNPVVGIWTTAERQSVRTQMTDGSQDFSGPYVSVSRLGMPLVNEVVVPRELKDHFNASQPVDDLQYAPAVKDPMLPHIVKAVYGLEVPDCDGNPNDGNIDRSCDLFPVYLTGLKGLNDFGLDKDIHQGKVVPYEALRLNMSTPLCGKNAPACNSLGVIAGDPQGFPNGRRLSDDIIDVSLKVVEGCLIDNNCGSNTLGDGVDANDRAFQKHIPYLAMPWAGSDPDPHYVRFI